uniref:Bm10333 n=1 Tax=Brugia malayi TaxID=6279 RepID=A0A0K0IMW5_BRUMA|nr:Bm10333 [Brugia malayi]
MLLEVIVVAEYDIAVFVVPDVLADDDDDDVDDGDGDGDDGDNDGDGGNEIIDDVLAFRELRLCMCEQFSAIISSFSSPSLSLSCKCCSISIRRSATKRSFTSILRDVCKHICK